MRCSVDKTPDCVENQAFFKEYIQIPAHYTSGKHKLKFSICQTSRLCMNHDTTI